MTETMNFNEQIELARMLARFKLQVRRELNESVDLNRLKNDPDYARERLAQIEDQTADEELLVMLLVLRERLVAGIMPPPVVPPKAEAADAKYRFGARG